MFDYTMPTVQFMSPKYPHGPSPNPLNPVMDKKMVNGWGSWKQKLLRIASLTYHNVHSVCRKLWAPNIVGL